MRGIASAADSKDSCGNAAIPTAEEKAKAVESALAEMRSLAEKSTSLQELVDTGRQAVDVIIALKKNHDEKLSVELSDVALVALNRAQKLHKLGELPCPDEQLSRLLEANGDLAGAIEHEKAFVACIEAGKEGPARLLRLAKLCQSAGKLEEAVGYLNTEVARDTDDTEAFEMLYEIAATQGNWGAAARYAIRGQQAALTLMSECATEADFKKNVGSVLEAPNAVHGFPRATVPSSAGQLISERLHKGWTDISECERVQRAFVFASEARNFVRKYAEAIEKQVRGDTDEGKQSLKFIKIWKKAQRLEDEQATSAELEPGKVLSPP